MPFRLPLPEPRATEGWQAVIYDREGPEEPHVTIRFKTQAWRMSLRSGRFLDSKPPERLVPTDVAVYVREHLAVPLAVEWDRLHGENPVASVQVPKRLPGKKATAKRGKKNSKKKNRK